tara:strand:- start:3927 stop:4667 length:741 start_codon:yes stop_codon:yes gene_type:complete
MKKICFLGSKKIGSECLQHIFNKKNELDIEISYVLTNPRGKEIEQFCIQNGIKILKDLNTLKDSEPFDIGICVQYEKILKKKHIDKAKEIFINLHMAPLPEYRGCNQFSFAILNNDDIFGATIHQLTEQVDGGAIIFENRFKIPKDYWVEDLYSLTEMKSIELFKNSLPKIISNDFSLIPQNELEKSRNSSFHYRSEIEDIKKIELDWPEEKIKTHIRATSMPGFSKPYTLIEGQKIFFTKKDDKS